MKRVGQTAAKKPKRIKKGSHKAPARSREERILREAIKYLIRHHGGLLVPTALRKTRIKDIPVWIMTITLRYPTGFEGYVGELLYDGENFTFLTEKAVMDERVRQIAANPERDRKWNEYLASTFPSGKR